MMVDKRAALKPPNVLRFSGGAFQIEKAVAAMSANTAWRFIRVLESAVQRSGFSCRLAALANAAERRAGSASKTQKSSDLARRKAVSYNPVLDGIRGTASHLRLWCDIRLVEGQKRELLRQHVFMHPCLELWLIGSLSRLEPILPNNRVRPEVLESPDITHQPL
jgi:hypothetical protein